MRIACMAMTGTLLALACGLGVMYPLLAPPGLAVIVAPAALLSLPRSWPRIRIPPARIAALAGTASSEARLQKRGQAPILRASKVPGTDFARVPYAFLCRL
mgnify:CR=1 FL=1